MGMKETIERLAGLEVDLINRIWGLVQEDEDNFEIISRQLVEKPEDADLQNFINHALTGVLLAVAYFRFRETMKPFLSGDEMKAVFAKMTEAKTKNVIDHWHEPPEGAGV
jgi:hypothetical protein